MGKKAVITILGIQGGYVSNGKVTFTDSKNMAEYYFEKENNKKEYFNTLPLLIDKYHKEYTIIPIFTKESKLFNQEVLSKLYSNIQIDFNDKYLIKDEKNFKDVFSLFNKTIEEFNEVIIDVTHGFRHLPLLMLIDLMIINFKDIEKIEKILFAKEIIKHIPKKQKGEYEIIDLKDYLDLANISYALSSFNQNYTISNHIKTNNKDYNNFINELSNFSKHILANSLDALIISTNRKKSISLKIINYINKILSKDDDILKNFEPFLLEVKTHIEIIENYKDLKSYQRLFNISKNMLEKGYLLNSITLLSEAIGLYVKEIFKEINSDIKEFIEEFEQKVKQHKNTNKKYHLYSLSNQSKTLYKLGTRFSGDYLSIKYPNNNERIFNEKSAEITIRIKNYILDIKNSQNYEKIVNLINNIDILRNNLAHGNSSNRLEDVEKDIIEVLNKFEKLIIKKDI